MKRSATAVLAILAVSSGLVFAQAPVATRTAASGPSIQPSGQTMPAVPGPAPTGKRVKVLCSVFPVWMFTRNVATGSNLDIDLMLPPNLGCPHDYALTPQDMQKIASAEVLIVNGAGLEEFLGDPVKKANANVRVIDASAGITDLIAMKEDGDGQEEEGHHHAGVNPHLFADPLMAARMVNNIADGLAKIDPENAQLYARNAKEYAARLTALAEEFKQAAGKFRSRKIVTEHAVFDYLARDCGLEIVAVVEEAPGQEPSAAQMLQIIRKIKQSGAAAVFTEPQYPAKVSRTIAQEAKVPVAALDPSASGPADAGLDYYEKTMRTNLQTLQKVLGEKGT